MPLLPNGIASVCSFTRTFLIGRGGSDVSVLVRDSYFGLLYSMFPSCITRLSAYQEVAPYCIDR